MYVHITANDTAATQATRCAEHMEAACGEPRRLLDAIRCAHLAIMAAMVEGLSGTDGTGAYDDALARQHRDFMNGSRPDIPRDRTLHFSELFDRVQQAGRLAFSEPLRFTAEERGAAKTLDYLRQLIDHPKVTDWSVEVAQLIRPLQSFPAMLEKCVSAAPHRFLGGNDTEMREALARFREALAELQKQARSEDVE